VLIKAPIKIVFLNFLHLAFQCFYFMMLSVTEIIVVIPVVTL